MKHIFFLLFLISFIACDSVEKHRASIEELSGSWDTATQSINDFAASVQAEAVSHGNAIAGITIDEKAFAKLKPDAQAQITGAKDAAINAGAGYQNILGEIGSFVTSWTEKAATLTALKDGLAAGKIEGDVVGQVAELTAMVSDAQTKVTSWTETFNSVKAACASSNEGLTGLIAQLLPNK